MNHKPVYNRDKGGKNCSKIIGRKIKRIYYYKTPNVNRKFNYNSMLPN